MAAKNEHTGATLMSKPSTDAYRDNYDRIFGKKKEKLDRRLYYIVPAENEVGYERVTLTEQEAVDQMRKNHGEDVAAYTDKELLVDFIQIHWARYADMDPPPPAPFGHEDFDKTM